jgi:GT2 family glycosyltransferase
MAHAPIIAIMNPDVRLTKPVFKKMLKSFENEDVVMCGGKQLTAVGKENWSFAFDYNVWGPLRIALRNIYKRIDKYDYRYMHLSGAFFMVRKKEFEAIGLFDESIFMYGEECDIHLRFRKMYPSKKMLFMPHITYLHLSREREFSAKRYQNTLNADVYVCKKHGASVSSYFAGAKFAVIMCYLRAVLQKDDYVKQITPLQLSVLNNTIKNGNK